MATNQRNEGEGNRTAAKAYNKATTAFAKSGKVGAAAQRAKKSLDTAEVVELKRAEAIGRRPAKGAFTASRAKSSTSR
jgi:hypothetical protein